jgi:C4-dicarboxylate-binding protein DctP
MDALAPTVRRTLAKTLAGVTLAFCAAIAGAQQKPAPSQQQIVITFSHVVAEDTPKGRAALYFKSLAEKRTGGRVRVDVYPDSKLVGDSEELAALQSGKVQMLAPSLAKFAPFGVPEFEVFDLPYLFDSYADLHRVTMGPVGRELLDKLRAKGIVGLAYWDNGFKQMSANKPLRQPSDLKGLKMRVQPSSVIQAQMRALGATPVILDFSAVHDALKTGKVDGAENPATNFLTQHLEDVQKDLAVTYHGYIGYAVIVNAKFWDGLPADIRVALTGAMRDATVFANDIASEANIDALEEIERSGKTHVVRLSPRDRAEWKKALLPVHREVEKTAGASVLKAIYAETGYTPRQP